MDKKPIVGAAAALYILIAGSFGVGGEALAQGSGAGKSCRDNPSGSLDHDTCVLSRNGSSGGGDSATWLCKVFDDSGLLEILGWSYGECVRNMKSS